MPQVHRQSFIEKQGLLPRMTMRIGFFGFGIYIFDYLLDFQLDQSPLSFDGAGDLTTVV